VLRVALDATPLLGDRTGVGNAVAGTLRALAARRDLHVGAYGLTLTGWRALPAALPAGVQPASLPMPAGPLLRLWAHVDIPRAELWTGTVDVVHGTNFVVPPARRAARLVSVWDMTPVRFPQLATATSRRYPHLIRRAVRAGAWVHTGSSFVAAEIVEHFGVPPERVKVVPPGVDRPASRQPKTGGRPYVLGLGRVEPRKDFPGLVRAFDELAGSHPDLELVVAGPPGWDEDRLGQAVRASPYRDRIRRLGWVDDAASLIAGAQVFAYPSLYEGFGLPPLEAMALGVPVVATSAGAVPEVVGEAALLVAPGDTAALAGALERLLSDAAARAELVAAGERRAGLFTWEACAEGLVDAYRQLARRAPRRRPT